MPREHQAFAGWFNKWLPSTMSSCPERYVCEPEAILLGVMAKHQTKIGYIYIYIYVHIYIYIHIHNIYIYIHIYICTYIHTYITLHYITLHYITLHTIHTYIHTYIHIYIYLHIYIYIYIIYLHIYIYIIYLYEGSFRDLIGDVFISCGPLTM